MRHAPGRRILQLAEPRMRDRPSSYANRGSYELWEIAKENNKALVRHWLDLWNQHALDQLAALVAPDYIHHGSSGDQIDFSGFQQGFAAVLRAYPDMHYTIQKG
jgi:hypothetical protein